MGSGAIGIIPTSKKELLWTNSSPVASFAAQTVELDLSNYDAVVVTATATTSAAEAEYGQKCTRFLLIGSGDYLESYGGTSGIVISIKPVLATTSGVEFGATNYNGSTNNGRVIPYQIYGIKI